MCPLQNRGLLSDDRKPGIRTLKLDLDTLLEL